MFAHTITYKLIVLAWLKFIRDNSDSRMPDWQNDTKFSAYLFKEVCSRTPVLQVAGDRTIAKGITTFRSILREGGEPKEFDGAVLRSFITFCNEVDITTISINGETSGDTDEYALKNYYQYVIDNGYIYSNVFEYVIKTFILRGKDVNSNLPNNIQPNSFCRDLEFKTPDIVVNVITPNLDWACYYIDEIIESVQVNNTYYYYLLTASDSLTVEKKKLILSEANKEKTSNINIIDLTENNKVNKDYSGTAYKRRSQIFQESESKTVFPIPYDFIIYENIPNEISKQLNQIYFDRMARNMPSFIGAIGTPPFVYQSGKEFDKTLNYYDVLMHAKDARMLLSWFNNIWEAISGNMKEYPNISYE